MQLCRPLFACAWLLLAGCNGDAPALTCRTPCASSNEYRDLFCVCRVKPPPGQNTQWPSPPSAGDPQPTFDWTWQEADGCALNRHYWLINPGPKRLSITVTWKVQGSDDRERREYTLPARVTNRNDGIDLGYEEEKSNSGGLCFDKDFMLGGWREPQHASIQESVFAALDESADAMRSRHRTTIAQMQSVVVASLDNKGLALPLTNAIQIHADAPVLKEMKKIEMVDCVSICDSADSMRCAMRGFPPDQDKLKHTRDRLRQTNGTGTYDPADIYSIFGLQKQSCVRSDVTVVRDKVFNTGAYCAFPSFLRDTDVRPFFALHFPENVRGVQVKKNDSTAGIVFNAGTGMPNLLFANPDYNSDFGGGLLSAMASDKGVYYQTGTACIFAGVK